MRRARKEDNESNIVSYLCPLRKNFAGIALKMYSQKEHRAGAKSTEQEQIAGAKCAKRLMRQCFSFSSFGTKSNKKNPKIKNTTNAKILARMVPKVPSKNPKENKPMINPSFSVTS